MGLGSQLSLLLRRNFLIKKRDKRGLAFELLFPVMFFGILMMIKNATPKDVQQGPLRHVFTLT